MADAAIKPSGLPALATGAAARLERLAKRTELIFALGFVGILAVLLLPVPGFILSALIAVNLALSLLILLVCIYAREPLEFNAFPSLLLVTTMMRLGLNVASTRLILLTGTGGAVIETFGHFVVGGNFVVGVVIFVILLIIQLMVVTKGAGRISEVAARFVLDAMPGKQMAIDADLNAGLISEKDARERRKKIEQEAEFYGAMDGAGKFVKGDAIAGLIITIVNITAGFVIGMTMMNMSASQALTTFTILTVGDGLVSQIPSFMVTIGSGLLVTKTRSEDTIGTELAREFFLKPQAFLVGGLMIAALGLIPGMPTLVFFALGGGCCLLGWTMLGAEKENKQAKAATEQSAAPKVEEKVEDLVGSDRIAVEIGYRLIPLVDSSRGGTLLERVTALRKQLARDQGLLVPPIRIKDNIQLPPGNYRVLIHGQSVAQGELSPDRLLAIDGGSVSAPVPGQTTKEPAFGLDAVWIEPNRRTEAETAGWTVTDPASVFITHLTQILKANAAAILNREDVASLIGTLKRESPALAKEIETGVKPALIQKVLSLLLEEKVPIQNLEKILETISDAPTGSPESLSEQARIRIGRSVVAPYLDGRGALAAIILEPVSEQRLSQAITGAQQGGGLGIAPAEASALIDRLGKAVREAMNQGRDPVLLTTASLRRPLRQITSRFHTDLPVLSYSEIGTTAVDVVGTIELK
ncbi:flagellar biosynthesis protein FlhA [Planctomycetota bacterium]|nr:flagellar biosynthesis protein FlhA [Planctomycetota bacterium]